MAQDVLAETGSEMEFAEVIDELLVQTVDIDLFDRLEPRVPDEILNLLFRFDGDLFDSGGLNPSVGDQPFESLNADLTANRTEASDHHRAGSVVDDDFAAGRFLESADIPPLAADDPAFHIVAGNIDHRGRRLGGIGGGVTLHRQKENVPCLLLTPFGDVPFVL